MQGTRRLLVVVGWTVIVGLQLITYGAVTDRYQRNIAAEQHQAIMHALVERIDLLEAAMSHIGGSGK